jgi:chromosome segregation ATPase
MNEYLFDVVQAVTPSASPQTDIVQVIITSIISTAVFAAFITGLVQYLINRRNSRITERKNTIDAESDIITRYKEAAAEERAQKESAVQTVKNLLSIAESQVESLKSTVVTLNASIDLMTKMANAQQEVIDQLTFDRDRTKIALERAVTQIDQQKQDLIRHQQEILELTYSKEAVAKIKQQAAKNFNSETVAN